MFFDSLHNVGLQKMDIRWNRSKSFQFLANSWDENEGYWAGLGEINEFRTTNRFSSRYSAATARELWSIGLVADLLLDYELRENIKAALIPLVKSAYNEDGLCVSFSQPCPLPPDVDATALCTLILLKTKNISTELTSQIAVKLAQNVDEDNIIKVWFTNSGPFSKVIDISISVSGLLLLYTLNAQHLATKTEDFIWEALTNGTVPNHFCYYHSMDQLIYMLSRIALLSPEFEARFKPLLKKEIEQQLKTTKTPLPIAQRIIACQNLGIDNQVDPVNLAKLQHPDGSWDEDIIFQYTQPDGVTFAHGSKEITTAFCIKALCMVEESKIKC